MTRPTFHARLSQALKAPAAKVIKRGYTSSLYCAPALDETGKAIPGRGWHLVVMEDMPTKIRFDGPCGCFL